MSWYYMFDIKHFFFNTCNQYLHQTLNRQKIKKEEFEILNVKLV